MKIIETSLPEVKLLEPKVWQDARGYFFESYHQETWRSLGLNVNFVQDNESASCRGTLRGMHYQLRHPQAKLCRVVQGAVLDVALDIRRGSPTFGRWTSTILSADNKLQMLLPQGFAHGFLVLSESATFLYKCSDFYHSEDERVVAWDDPDLAIDWGLAQHGIDHPVLSAKDAAARPLNQIPPEELPLVG